MRDTSALFSGDRKRQAPGRLGPIEPAAAPGPAPGGAFDLAGISPTGLARDWSTASVIARP
jgi:hypothetical protein